METLKFSEVVEHCEKTKCNAFALNDEKKEVFVVEYVDYEGEFPAEYILRHSGDLEFDGECGFEDDIEINTLEKIDDALKEIPYLGNLVFYPFNADDANWSGMIYSYAKQSLLKAANIYKR